MTNDDLIVFAKYHLNMIKQDIMDEEDDAEILKLHNEHRVARNLLENIQLLAGK